MSLPFFPLYATDFEADTAHLTLAEDGAYNRLLRLCWLTPGCTLPDDSAWIYRRMRASSEADRAVIDSVLGEFFTRKNGRVFSQRLKQEASLAKERHKKRVRAGRSGGKSYKSLKTRETEASNAQAMLKQPQPQPQPLKERDAYASQKKAGKRLPEDWKLPKDWGAWALAEGWSEDVIRDEAEKFRDFWVAKAGKDAAKLDWKATWRNWMRNSKQGKGQHGPGAKEDAKLSAFISGARRGAS